MTWFRRAPNTLIGLLLLGGALATAGAWIPATGNPVADDDCGCTTPQDAVGLPQDLLGRREGDWCLTQPMFEANLPIGRELPRTAEACTQYGPPDVPAVRDAAIPDGTTPIKTVRLMIHVFRENNGGNAAATQSDVVNAVDRLNANYAAWRIQFVFGWRFVNDTKFRYLDSNESGQMKSKYALSPATQLNLFVTTYNPGGSWGTFPWDANSLTKYGGIVLHQPHFLDPAVPSHEVGHCLGLWHTFHGVSEVTQCSDCYEPAGRSAEIGDLTGDKCSDTNPSPRNFNCSDPAGTDPCSGNSWLDTPIHNYMSYSLSCATEFTTHQAGRMHAWTEESLTGWLELPPPPAVPGTPSLSTSGSVITIVWVDNSNDEDGFQVQRETKGSRNKWVNQQTIADVGANVTSTTDSPGAGTFRYRVRAYNGNGASNWSGWAQINN